MSAKKILCLFFAVLMIVSCFVGCGNRKTTNDKVFETFEDFEGATLGAATGSDLDMQTMKLFPNNTINRYDSITDLVLSLESGKIDGFLLDEAYASAIAWEREGYKTIASDKTVPTQFAYVVSENEFGRKLKGELNEFIAEMKANGEIDRLAKKWFSGTRPTEFADISSLTGENGTIDLALSDTDLPMCYQNDTVLTGFDVEFIIAFAKKYGYDFTLSTVDFDAMLTGVQTEKYHLAIGGITITEERKEKHTFTDCYFESPVYMIARDNAVEGESKLSDLTGQRIGVMTGSIQAVMMPELVPDAEYMEFNSIYRDGNEIDSLTIDKTKRTQIAGIGKYVVFFPDKKYYNTETKEHGSMEETITAQMIFTEKTVEIKEEGKTFKFKKGDRVEISGSSVEENNKTIIIREDVEETKLTFYANSFTASAAKEGETEIEPESITISRTVPDLDFVCESNYRLWGTKGNTIYGSKFMDPLNFQSFDGLAGDSYYIDVGSDGEFTGCAPYTSHICFFKENTVHKLYGSKPSNFQIVTSQVYGVQAGSERSICVINETMFYKGVNGVYAYTGGIPDLVSERFGMRRYTDACAATDGNKYYITMKETGGNRELYAFDIARNIWVREENMNIVDMATKDGVVKMLTTSEVIHRTGNSDGVEWSVTFCPFNETMNERKGYSKFHLRLDLAAGAWLQVEVKRNTDTKWHTVYTTHNEREKTVTVPILPARCDSVEIRLSGKGECKLRTFIREFFVGSDV
ncbi:MAG: transporter substrate-binding domain-containing protein [Ruminococcaceae bacterium]|nr:transporter substrate-binding domain-containing protein [Oscillospiraceae bacterium]